MAVYAIGDVQGCYDALRRLLDALRFEPAEDCLWFTGDLVNRGPASAAVLRFVAGLGNAAVSVLGNHDLHLLAVAAGVRRPSRKDTFRDVLEAEDSEQLLTWLAARPLVHYDPHVGYALVHAGLPPMWSMAEALQRAREVEPAIRARQASLFEAMYGDEPSRWTDELTGIDRVRFTVNGFTRMRYCAADGRLDFVHKGPPGSQPPDLVPWFKLRAESARTIPVVFGHWSTLGYHDGDGVVALDTGCCWGGELTAVRLAGSERLRVSVTCGA